LPQFPSGFVDDLDALLERARQVTLVAGPRGFVEVEKRTALHIRTPASGRAVDAGSGA